MNPSTLRALLGGLASLLMVALWYFSQYPWSEVQTITSELTWTGSRQYDSAKFTDEIGSNFYIGGSFAILLAAGWLAVMSLNRQSEDGLPGIISLGVAIWAAIALARWYQYLNTFQASRMNLYGGTGAHHSTFECDLCLVITVALAVVGGVLLRLGPPPKAEKTAATQSP